MKDWHNEKGLYRQRNLLNLCEKMEAYNLRYKMQNNAMQSIILVHINQNLYISIDYDALMLQ